MIAEFINRRKLVSILEELATYNDKGIAWKKHDAMQVSCERARIMNKLEKLISAFSEDQIPIELLEAVKSRKIETDCTGQYVGYARNITL